MLSSLQRRVRTLFRGIFWRLRLLLRALGRGISTGFWALALPVAARAARRFRGGQRLYWGPDPLINIKYLSDALRDAGYESTTVVSHDFANFKGTRFDRYHDEIVAASRLPTFLASRMREYVVFLHLLRNYDIAHIPYTGGPLGRTRLARREPRLLQSAGIRTVMVPYGGDFFRYSWIQESLMRHAMLLNYPEPGRNEEEIDRRVKMWQREADIVVGSFLVEGASRWDVLPTNYIAVTADRVKPRQEWGRADGEGEPVKVLHAPNHRGVKGTGFIIAAVEELKGRGLAIDFELLENTPNEQVLAAMRGADICVDHCVGSGYGLFAIEAMGSGATVMANLEDEQRLGVHRHYGWLNQCPVVSANIEELIETMEYLIRHPEVREELGRMGIDYVRRFHAPETAQHMFGSIYRKLAGEDIDLLTLFHPNSEYMRRAEPIRPPLRRNRPAALLDSGRGGA